MWQGVPEYLQAEIVTSQKASSTRIRTRVAGVIARHATHVANEACAMGLSFAQSLLKLTMVYFKVEVMYTDHFSSID